MTRDEMELRRRNWLWLRWEAALELCSQYKLSDEELQRALSEAESGNWAGPLKLIDGTELPEQMPGMPKAMKRERSHDGS